MEMEPEARGASRRVIQDPQANGVSGGMPGGAMRESAATVDLSVRVYTWLLAAYPGSFRAEYGNHMAQVFRDVCMRDFRRGGARGMSSLWARTSLDLLQIGRASCRGRG